MLRTPRINQRDPRILEMGPITGRERRPAGKGNARDHRVPQIHRAPGSLALGHQITRFAPRGQVKIGDPALDLLIHDPAECVDSRSRRASPGSRARPTWISSTVIDVIQTDLRGC